MAILNGSEGGFITKKDVDESCNRFKEESTPKTIRAHYFGKEKLLLVLNQQKAVGARFYFGLGKNTNGSFKPQLIAVGVDEYNKDLNGEGDLLLNISLPCPPFCPPPPPPDDDAD